jgi:DNA-binding CsgD family transcriptional regulator
MGGPTRAAAGRGWAYVGAVLGGAVSVAANVAHSYVPPAGTQAGWQPPGGAVAFAVVWPVFLFVAVEILARVDWRRAGRWAAVRYAGLLPVALVAAGVSYRHLSGLLAFYGEDRLIAAFGPLAVDGLMVMATGALIATASRRSAAPVAVADAVPDGRVSRAPDARTDNAADARADSDADASPDTRADGRADVPGSGVRTRAARVSGTAAAVARLRRRYPDMSSAEIARRLGVTDRTVRRHLASGRPEPATTDPTAPESVTTERESAPAAA